MSLLFSRRGVLGLAHPSMYIFGKRTETGASPPGPDQLGRRAEADSALRGELVKIEHYYPEGARLFAIPRLAEAQ